MSSYSSSCSRSWSSSIVDLWLGCWRFVIIVKHVLATNDERQLLLVCSKTIITIIEFSLLILFDMIVLNHHIPSVILSISNIIKSWYVDFMLPNHSEPSLPIIRGGCFVCTSRHLQLGPSMAGLSWAVLRHIASNRKVLVYGAHPVCCGNENIHLQCLGLSQAGSQGVRQLVMFSH